MSKTPSTAGDDKADRPTRGEVAEYIHDMAGQLAEMALSFGLLAAADALKRAQAATENEY